MNYTDKITTTKNELSDKLATWSVSEKNQGLIVNRAYKTAKGRLLLDIPMTLNKYVNKLNGFNNSNY